MIMRGFRVLSRAKRVDNRAYKRLWSDKIHLLKAFDGMYVQDTLDQWFPLDDILPVNAQMPEITPDALTHGVSQVADDAIEDDARTVGPSLDRLSPSAPRDRARPRAEPSAPMPPPTPRDSQLGQSTEEAAGVMRSIDRLVTRISARERTPVPTETAGLAKLDAPIQSAAEANAAVELRRNLFVEKSATKQRTPNNAQRLERIQASIRSVNARLRAWEKQHPEWRPGG
jgi:hypothetical protein